MVSSFGTWLIEAPVWLIGLFILGGMIVASLAGTALRWRRRKRIAAGRESTAAAEDGDLGIMVSAVMGLLALLVAFTFSIAIDRFDTRRVNVLNEANAIGTTYLRAQLLEEPHRARMSRLLVAYTDLRLVLATTPRGPEQRALLEANDRLIADLWSATVAAFPSMRTTPLSHSFVETMNGLIDMDTTRKAGRQARVPPAVFLVLFLYQFVAASVVSYCIAGRRSQRTAIIVFALLGVLMVLIVDVDRPTGGGIEESQEPMRQLQAFLRAQPPASFDRFEPTR